MPVPMKPMLIDCVALGHINIVRLHQKEAGWQTWLVPCHLMLDVLGVQEACWGPAPARARTLLGASGIVPFLSLAAPPL